MLKLNIFELIVTEKWITIVIKSSLSRLIDEATKGNYRAQKNAETRVSLVSVRFAEM